MKLTSVAAARWVAPVAVVALTGVCMWPASPASADNNNVYSLSAQANSVAIKATVPGAPVITEYDASPYGSSATLNSTGQSSSDAGAPYAPIVTTLPATVNGLGAGQLPPLPPVPGYVTASYPSQVDNVEAQGIYSVEATAQSTSASGAVKLGVTGVAATQPTASSVATVTANDDGSVTATATAGADLLNVGGLLDIGNISSTLTVNEQAGQNPTVAVATHLGSVTVAGINLDVLSGVLGTAGAPTALTSSLLSTLNGLLGASGITLSIVPVTYTYTDGTTSQNTPTAGKTIETVVSGALAMSVTHSVPALGNVVMTVTLGQVSATVDNAPGVAPAPLSGDTGGGAVTTTTDGTGGGLIASTGGSLGTIGASGTAPVTGTTGTSPTVTAPVTGSRPTQQLIKAAARLGPSAQGIYLMLVICALGALVGGQLFRFLAVRLSFSR